MIQNPRHNRTPTNHFDSVAGLPENNRVQATYEALGEAAVRLGDKSLPDALICCAEGSGAELNDLFAPIGRGPTVEAHATAGDVIVTAPLFAEEEPRIEIVGAPSGWEAAETATYPGTGTKWILRLADAAENYLPANNSGENLARIAQLVGLASSGGSAVKSVFEAGSAGVRLANEGIDLVQRVVQIGSEVRQSFNGLTFQSQPAALRVEGYTSPTAGENTTTYNLQLQCAHERGASITDPFNWAHYNFRVVIVHDCFNIIRAEVVKGVYDLGGYVGLMPHRLTISFQPDIRTFRAASPGQIRFRVTGLWDPADLLGRLNEGLNGTIIVRADGTARASGFSGQLVKASPVRRISGPSRAACQSRYDTLRRQRAPQGVTPTPPAPSGTGTGGQRWRPSSRPAVSDPPNGKNIFFRTGGSRITARHRAAVRSWWTNLGPNRREAVTRGQILVRVNGHADPTGSENTNIRLSARRAQVVAELVRQLAGTNARIEHEGVGSRVARENGARGRAPEWRRATIRITA